jgi:23S rRNA (pseudouridine1915-N3)-methyltransferase
MRLTIAAIGRLKPGPERELFKTYLDRLEAVGRNHHIGPVTWIEIPESKRRSAAARREDEARRLLEKLGHPPYLIVLDEAGDAHSSRKFADFLRNWRDAGEAELAFVVGGADGIGKPLTDKAKQQLALGPMTLSHGLARVVLAEQLYRAGTIIAGHPYHRE